MDINKLLIDSIPIENDLNSNTEQDTIHEEILMGVWEKQLYKGGFKLNTIYDRNTLTDCYISRNNTNGNKSGECTPIHIKVTGRHMSGSFRCHFGTSKQSRPIQTNELSKQMRIMVVFFRVESGKCPWVMTDFICFPTWLLHLFQYSSHGIISGRTDIRFLKNASIAKDDHIYRLNHVINTLFRFQLYSMDYDQLEKVIHLSNYLFDIAGLNPMELPRPNVIMHCDYQTDKNKLVNQPTDNDYSCTQPSLYSSLFFLLRAPRPTKVKTMCCNCNSKPASRRQLCVACYRYQLKYNTPRPLRLIVANNSTPKSTSFPILNSNSYNNSKERYSITDCNQGSRLSSSSSISSTSSISSISTPISNSSLYLTSICSSSQIIAYKQPRIYTFQQVGIIKSKMCVNCGVKETHQWYRNICGQGHWCETCKSYYLRHGKVRPPELFIKAAKRKIDVRSWIDWSFWKPKK
ncbi:unnamed protein product [Cunninghamella blakesleeana]